MRVDREPAFVLHTRDYRETSLLLEVFTSGYGRLGLVAKGAKRPKSGVRGVLHPFQPLTVSWAGKGELGVLTAAEPTGTRANLRGEALYCGFYLNELLMRLLHRHDPHESLFEIYRHALDSLALDSGQEATLRIFEKRLLQELGYALLLDREAAGNDPVKPEQIYNYVIDRGPVPVNDVDHEGVRVHGDSLLELAVEQIAAPRALQETKRLMRAVLTRYLDGKPLHSRKLFRSRNGTA
jgi:DNA repair protein RecO (recombination protein O)